MMLYCFFTFVQYNEKKLIYVEEKKMDKVILWDWDNTLADTFGAIFASQNALLLKLNMKPWSKKESKEVMNKAGNKIFEELFGKNKAKKANEVYWKLYHRNIDKVKLFDDAKEVLAEAKKMGFRNVVASNKDDDVLKKEIKQMKVQNLIDFAIGARKIKFDKPAKQFTDAALKNFNPQKIIAIGDSRSDILMARNYENAVAILVHSSQKSAEFNDVKPDFCVKSLNAALKILKKLS